MTDADLDKFNRFLKQRIHSLGGHSKHHVIDGCHVHSYELDGYGDGPPIVLLHGLGASAHSFFPVLRGLQQTWRKIYMPDLPGHGFSKHGQVLDIRGQQRIFLKYLDHVVKEPAALIGNSMGGAIVLQTAIDRPETRALGLLCPAGAPLTEADITMLRSGFLMDSRAKAIDFFNRLTHRPTPIGWLIASDLMEMFQVPHIQHILQETKTAEQIESAQIRSLKMPVTLVWGASEKILPADGIEFFRRTLPSHARIELFDSCGHLPMMEQPRRTLALINALATQASAEMTPPVARSM